MLSIFFGCFGAVLGLLIYYVRVVSVVVDERSSIEKDDESLERYKFVLSLSEKLERVWPIVEPLSSTSWARYLSNAAVLIVFSVLLFLGLFRDYVADYAGTLLILLFLLSSISGGPKSIDTYHKIKPYLPIILPAIIYQSLTMLAVDQPETADLLIIPGYTFQETKVMGVLIGFFMAFIIPYPMAKFDQWFSIFIAKSTLYFVKDLMRLGVQPLNNYEAGLRKIAKETLPLTLKTLLVLLAIITFLFGTP